MFENAGLFASFAGVVSDEEVAEEAGGDMKSTIVGLEVVLLVVDGGSLDDMDGERLITSTSVIRDDDKDVDREEGMVLADVEEDEKRGGEGRT